MVFIKSTFIKTLRAPRSFLLIDKTSNEILCKVIERENFRRSHQIRIVIFIKRFMKVWPLQNSRQLNYRIFKKQSKTLKYTSNSLTFLLVDNVEYKVQVLKTDSKITNTIQQRSKSSLLPTSYLSFTEYNIVGYTVSTFQSCLIYLTYYSKVWGFLF